MKLRKMKLGKLVSNAANAVTDIADSFSETRKRFIYTSDRYSDALQKKFDEIADTIKARLENGYLQTEEFIATGNFKNDEDKTELVLH
jgi:uncharacterized Ntn-hydrolase superfamily protein